jgi:hypothetical protein
LGGHFHSKKKIVFLNEEHPLWKTPEIAAKFSSLMTHHLLTISNQWFWKLSKEALEQTANGIYI